MTAGRVFNECEEGSVNTREPDGKTMLGSSTVDEGDWERGCCVQEETFYSEPA